MTELEAGFLQWILISLVKGPSKKYVTLEGGGVREGVTVCDRGEWGGKEHVTSRLYKFLSYIWNMKFKVMFNFLL